MLEKKNLSSGNELREAFLNYFQTKFHQLVASSSLVPDNDPTLLFTNAGMVQFKEVFLGTEQRPYKRAASSQRCVRAGGKHNDLERVGYTARHHTFFEMLGNFSFGDYFKREAIQFAWDFLTNILHLPPEKLWITVFRDDDEAANIWLNEVGIDPKRFSRCDEADNFWAMGATGPCGPCTEIFYDHGPNVAGGPPGTAEADGDRYVEIWNLVFMQYDRLADGSLVPLPKPSVDTGMGLERITAVMQGVTNNYDTDLFQPLIKTAANIAGMSNLADFSLRVIADHIRSCAFLIIDGITPSNENRGYVLRRIMRRAIRHGHKLGINQPFFYKLVAPLSKIMGAAYPALIEQQAHIEKIIRLEEEQFSATLTQGLKLFEQMLAQLKEKVLPGDLVFKLYDTYGFPADLTADIARERGIAIDEAGFEKEMKAQRERSRSASQFGANYTVAIDSTHETEFTGYIDVTHESLTDTGKVLAIYREGKFTEELSVGEKASIVLDRSPFYAEAGGQVGDHGLLKINDTVFFKVFDTIKQGHMHLHLGKLDKGVLHIGDEVTAEIDLERRQAIVLNHTATHLLHMVLKKVLGEHAMQKGSLVEPERLRFDFSHHEALTPKQLTQIEADVNALIRANLPGSVDTTTPEQAKASGAVALFGEKYGSKVRVVSFGPSVELCGGTHASHTGNIGLFKITGESGIAAGIRRIEAVTGAYALAFIDKREEDLKIKLKQAQDRTLQLDKELLALKDKMAASYSEALASQAKKIGSSSILAMQVEGLDGKALRRAVDHLKKKLGSAVIILAAVKGNKVGMVAGVSDDLVKRINAKEMLNYVAEQVGGRGGGRADLAEAGGNKPECLEKALESVYTWIEERKP